MTTSSLIEQDSTVLLDADPADLLAAEACDGRGGSAFAQALERLLDDSDAAPVARFQSRI